MEQIVLGLMKIRVSQANEQYVFCLQTAYQSGGGGATLQGALQTGLSSFIAFGKCISTHILRCHTLCSLLVA